MREVELSGQEIIVGRLPSSDITLEGDVLVSRRHVRIYAQRGSYHVMDLGSSNGTLVDGDELSREVPLAGGERIRVGSYEIRYEVVEPATPAHPIAAASAAEPNPEGTPPSQEDRSQPLWSESPDPDERDARAGVLWRAEYPAPDATVHGPLAGSIEPEISPPERQSASGPDSGSEIELLKEQVRVLGALVRQRAERDALLVDSLRGELIYTRAVLSSLLNSRESTLLSAASETQAMIGLARETAQNPTHIEYVSRFAGHAGEIAVVLEHLLRRGIGRDVRSTLGELLERLEGLLGSPAIAPHPVALDVTQNGTHE